MKPTGPKPSAASSAGTDSNPAGPASRGRQQMDWTVHRERRHPDRHRQAIWQFHRRPQDVAGDPARQLCHVAGTVRLRQDDHVEDDRGASRSDRRRYRDRRQQDERPADPPPQPRHRLSELRSFSAQDGGRQRRLRPQVPQCPEGRGAAARRGGAGLGAASEPWFALSQGIVGRATAAGGAGQGHRDRTRRSSA